MPRGEEEKFFVASSSSFFRGQCKLYSEAREGRTWKQAAARFSRFLSPQLFLEPQKHCAFLQIALQLRKAHPRQVHALDKITSPSSTPKTFLGGVDEISGPGGKGGREAREMKTFGPDLSFPLLPLSRGKRRTPRKNGRGEERSHRKCSKEERKS